MVLDLVVQAAEGEVGEPAAADVACRQGLPSQEVGLVGCHEDRHALVVGGEGAAQVEAERPCCTRMNVTALTGGSTRYTAPGPVTVRMHDACRLTASRNSIGTIR